MNQPIDWTKPIMAYGKPARLLPVEVDNQYYPRVVAYCPPGGVAEYVDTFDKDGRRYCEESQIIFNTPETRKCEAWAVWYKNGDFGIAYARPDKTYLALYNARAVKKLEFEMVDGEGL